MQTFDIDIDMFDDTGLDAVSLVLNPAVEVDFLKFSRENLSFTDEDKHIITGPALLADTPIYRESLDGTPYYVRFSKKVIKELVEKYFSHNLGNQVNIEHREDGFVSDVILIESYIIDKGRGICPNEFSSIPDGSWIVSYKVNNEVVWEKVKTGELRGFSVQGLFNIIESKFNKTKKRNMRSLKEALKSILMQFDGVSTDKGELTWEGEKQLEVGDSVYLDGEVAPDGEYKTDEKVFVVSEGKVAEVKENEAPVEEKVEETLEEEVAEEVAPEVPEKPAELVELENKVAELEKTIADLMERVSKIENEPVVEPVVDEFEQVRNRKSSGDKTVDKYSRIFGSK